jgi:hypothetical protein
MHEICRKDHLARNASRMSRIVPHVFDFIPKTWILPLDLADLVAYSKSFKKPPCLIAKPDRGCQGKGIFLLRDPTLLSVTDTVVQSYISNPCLLDGLKFDLRVYVLVTSVEPLRIFVYQEGLGRFATQEYKSPNKSNLSNAFMHLTNYAINKHSMSFSSDNETGSKRSLQYVLHQLEKERGCNKEELWSSICDCIIKTITLVQPQLGKVAKSWFPKDPKTSMYDKSSQCFEILGFDILLDSQLKPWVLEVNHSPSFTCDSQLDLDIKSGVIYDALKLMNILATTESKIARKEKAKSQSRLYKTTKVNDFSINPAGSYCVSHKSEESASPNSAQEEKPNYHEILIKQYYDKFSKILLVKLQNIEDKNCGGYQRIFPPNDEKMLGTYLHLMKEAGKYAGETTATRARKAFQEQKKDKETKILRQMEELKHKKQSSNIKHKVYSFISTIPIKKLVPTKQRQSISLSIHNLGDHLTYK